MYYFILIECFDKITDISEVEKRMRAEKEARNVFVCGKQTNCSFAGVEKFGNDVRVYKVITVGNEILNPVFVNAV